MQVGRVGGLGREEEREGGRGKEGEGRRERKGGRGKEGGKRRERKGGREKGVYKSWCLSCIFTH